MTALPARGIHVGRSYFCGFPRTSANISISQALHVSDVLPELDEVDGVLARDLLGIERPEAQEGLTAHIGGQPVPVGILHGIPEEFLLLAHAVDGFYQAPGEQIGKGPY